MAELGFEARCVWFQVRPLTKQHPGQVGKGAPLGSKALSKFLCLPKLGILLKFRKCHFQGGDGVIRGRVQLTVPFLKQVSIGTTCSSRTPLLGPRGLGFPMCCIKNFPPLQLATPLPISWSLLFHLGEISVLVTYWLGTDEPPFKSVHCTFLCLWCGLSATGSPL